MPIDKTKLKKELNKNILGSFYKTVEGGEGERCYYPTRLDTYGKGCYYNCRYCYARGLLSFRGMWKPNRPATPTDKELINTIRKIPSGSVVRLGGMTDCFQPIERLKRKTYKAIQLLNKKRVQFLRLKSLNKNNILRQATDFRKYTYKEGGYYHLPLKIKKQVLNRLHFKEMSVCEDVNSHYYYFQNNYNHNPADCCNLRKIKE